MFTRLMTTTRLCYMWHHTTEASRLHSCCSNMVQMSMCGTRRVRLHCAEHWSTSDTSSGVITLMPYSSYWRMVRTLTLWMMTGDHSTPLHLASQYGSIRATYPLL